jgi:putative Holliday junction resolvase
MRYLGIDYGRRRLGLAVSDEDAILASPLPTYARRSETRDLKYLQRLVSERGVTGIVIGLPLNMNGSRGEMVEEVDGFAEQLERETGVTVDVFDERLTTQEAERVLVEADLSRKRRRKLRDSVAAVLILQGFLDRRRAS